jgi:anti-sigma regulatory factor (Ser/Thr protein kinase)
MSTSSEETVFALVRAHGTVSAALVAAALDVSRATAHRRLAALVKDKRLLLASTGRTAHYELPTHHWKRSVDKLSEDVLMKDMEPTLVDLGLSTADLRVATYAITEIVNNAIDHSGSKSVTVVAKRDLDAVVITVADSGVGTFARVQTAHGFATADEALLALEKGKLTSDPKRHSGEGLFFVSKVVSRFRLDSGQRGWLVDNVANDTAVIPLQTPRAGTLITMVFLPGRLKTLPEIFAAFTDDDHAFTKTRTTVKLASVGQRLMSRSEAKRLLVGVERFQQVELDFHGVELVGQGFCDEIFRVFQMAHLQIEFVTVRMSTEVAFMVARARKAVSTSA